MTEMIKAIRERLEKAKGSRHFDRSQEQRAGTLWRTGLGRAAADLYSHAPEDIRHLLDRVDELEGKQKGSDDLLP
ncbi:hypothetical protein LCGC14_2353230 [marine sediment metagenome]|uniref:Uncharacterized protein n=1 Tax=marine sediment metagenome TaxID=412755 RepID=A0A0F9C930_9ZZZZ